MMDVDGILEAIGSRGRWQVTQYVLLGIHFLSSACVTLAIVFIGYRPTFRCESATGEFTSNSTGTAETNACTVHDNSTNTSISCGSGFIFDVHRMDLTIVTEWQLVCDRAFLSELSQTLMYAGLGIGSMFGTPLADKVGRKKTYLLSEIIVCVLTFAASFSPNVAVFIVFRLLGAAFAITASQAAVISSIELFPVRYRTLIGTILGLNWAVGLIIYSGIAYLSRNLSWRHHQMIVSASSIIVIVSFLFTDESLRWLLARGRNEDAATLLMKAARINNVPLEEVCSHLKGSHAQESELLDALLSVVKMEDGIQIEPLQNGHKWSVPSEIRNDGGCAGKLAADTLDESVSRNNDVDGGEMTSIKESTKENILTLFRHSKLRFSTIAMAWGWLVNTLTYYGLYLMSGTLTDTRYLEFSLNALVEIPAIFLTYCMLKRYGRRVPCIAFHVACGLTLLLAAVLNVVQDSKIPVTVLVILGKFWITCSFALLVVLTSELFPTNIRTSAYGITSGTSRVGGMIAPFLGTLARLVSWAPGVIFATCCVSMAVCTYYLPETAKKALPQSVAEVDSWDCTGISENKENKHNKNTVI